MGGPRGSSPRRWWAPGWRGLARRQWTEVAAGVSRRGSDWSIENRSWGRDWMRWRDGVLLDALYRAGAASRGDGGEELVAADGV
jgi:hypothetical protein